MGGGFDGIRWGGMGWAVMMGRWDDEMTNGLGQRVGSTGWVNVTWKIPEYLVVVSWRVGRQAGRQADRQASRRLSLPLSAKNAWVWF